MPPTINREGLDCTVYVVCTLCIARRRLSSNDSRVVTARRLAEPNVDGGRRRNEPNYRPDRFRLATATFSPSLQPPSSATGLQQFHSSVCSPIPVDGSAGRMSHSSNGFGRKNLSIVKNISKHHSCLVEKTFSTNIFYSLNTCINIMPRN